MVDDPTQRTPRCVGPPASAGVARMGGEDAREILRPAVKSAGSQDDKLKRVDGFGTAEAVP